MRLLLVEDEVSIRTALTAYLNQAGYVVDEADDGQEGSYFFAEFDYSVAIVDVGLPKLDGLSLIKSVRRNGNKTPILILTARDHWQEKVAGLDAGADDYVAKPFQIEEVLARLNALVRRAAGHASAEIVYGEFTLDGRQQCVSVSKMPLELTEFEY
ncbi:MAG: response regulator transcription factor, partial [Gammaproteobacteria bacterium]